MNTKIARTTSRQKVASPADLASILRSPFVRPVVEYALWTIAFWVASLLHQQPIYYLVLILVFVRDLQNVSERRKGLFRDFIAATMTSLLGWVFNDTLSWGLGFLVALIAGIALAQQVIDKIKQKIADWSNQ